MKVVNKDLMFSSKSNEWDTPQDFYDNEGDIHYESWIIDAKK